MARLQGVRTHTAAAYSSLSANPCCSASPPRACSILLLVLQDGYRWVLLHKTSVLCHGKAREAYIRHVAQGEGHRGRVGHIKLPFGCKVLHALLPVCESRSRILGVVLQIRRKAPLRKCDSCGSRSSPKSNDWPRNR